MTSPTPPTSEARRTKGTPSVSYDVTTAAVRSSASVLAGSGQRARPFVGLPAGHAKL